MSEKKIAELKEKLDRAPVLARIVRFDAFFPRRSEWQTLMDEFNLSQTLCSEYLQVRNDARTAYAAKVLAPESDSKQCDNADADADTPVASGEVDAPTS